MLAISEPRESPSETTEQPGRVAPQPAVEGAQEAAEPRSWWRRMFGKCDLGGRRVVEREHSRREQTEDLWAWMGDPVEVVFDDPHARSIQGVLRGYNHTGVFLVYVDDGDEPQTIFCPWTAVRLLRRG